MVCKVNGFNHIKSSKNGKDYTIVHVTTDIPFTNGGGTQNLQVVLEGKQVFTIGEDYVADIDNYLVGNELKTRVVGLS